jgi:hypothetical protein
MKKIIMVLALCVLLPAPVFAGNSFMYIKVCNMLNSYGPNGGPLQHNIEYVVKPQSKPYKTENLNGTLSWASSECKDVHIFGYDTSPTAPYPLSAELTIVDQQTKVVLWKGFVSKNSDYANLNFNNHTVPRGNLRVIGDAGKAVFIQYAPAQISVARY